MKKTKTFKSVLLWIVQILGWLNFVMLMMFVWVLVSFLESASAGSDMERLVYWYFMCNWRFQFVLLPATILAFITLEQFTKKLNPV